MGRAAHIHPQQGWSINVDTALRIGCALGTTPNYWLNLQSMYDIDVPRITTDISNIEPLVEAPRGTDIDSRRVDTKFASNDSGHKQSRIRPVLLSELQKGKESHSFVERPRMSVSPARFGRT